MFLSEKTSEALDQVYGAFFDLNATLDRVASLMLNVWTMPQASDIVHHKISHLMPLLADDISAIKDNYNMTSGRPEVHRDYRTYTDLSDMFETVLKEFGEVYEMIKMVDGIAHETGDFNVHGDLVKFIQKFNIVIGQVITLRDKAMQMPTGYDQFDRHITSWGIVGLDNVQNED